MDNIDVNVDHYTIDELLEIADLTYLASDEEVINVFTQYIKKYIRDKDFKLAQFFHDAKEKILQERNQEKGDELTDHVAEAERWLQNQYRDPANKDQLAKITDRRQTISLFDNPTQPVMSQDRLGINNVKNMSIMQDSLNPTFRQEITRIIMLNSKYRGFSVPYIKNPFIPNKSPSSYLATLQETLTNVTSMRVKSAYIPVSWYTFDQWYNNTSAIIFFAASGETLMQPDISPIKPDGTIDQSFCCAKIAIYQGRYNGIIDVINQINWSLSHCDCSGSRRDIWGYPGQTGCDVLKSGVTDFSMSNLQLHLWDPLNLTPSCFWINNTDLWCRIVFWSHTKPGFLTKNGIVNVAIDGSGCSACFSTDNTECVKDATYDNNLGYYLGFRLDERMTKFFNNDLTVVIPPVKYVNSVKQNYCNGGPLCWNQQEVEDQLKYMYINTQRWWDSSYNKYTYNYDINNLTSGLNYIDIPEQIRLPNSLNTLFPSFTELWPYALANVPLSLFANQFLFICVDDFQKNRAPSNLIGQQGVNTRLDIPSYAKDQFNTWANNNKSSGDSAITDVSLGIICDSSGQGTILLPTYPRHLTLNQIYSANQIQANRIQPDFLNLSQSPTYDNVLSVVSLASRDQAAGAAAVAVTDQLDGTYERNYFGPVNIEKLQVSLLDERGNLVNLNGKEWTLTLEIKQLYQY